MELRQTLAVAYKHHGRDRLGESAFVTALAIERDWFTPDEVRHLLARGREQGALDHETDEYVPAFDVGAVTVPPDFEPEATLVAERSLFERVVDELEAAGSDRRDVVANINTLQADTALSSDGAAVLYAHGQGLDVAEEARMVRESIEGDA